MVKIQNYTFNPTIKTVDVDRTRFIGLLPAYNQTDTIKNFTRSSIENLFTPGDDIQLNGYIGEKPSWNNTLMDYYIPEITSKRQFYQLSASMVSYDSDTSEYNTILNYPDYVDTLKIQGAITSNESRLFEENYYTWCPSIDIDKFINYQFYLWVSNDNEPTDPDYIVIDKSSSDQNPWSLGNNWVHHLDFNESNYPYPVTTTKAQRSIIEFFPNLELYKYGIYRRENIDLISTDSTGYNGIYGKTSVVIDGVTVDQDYITQMGGYIRVLILNDNIDTYNNRIYAISYMNDGLIISIESDGIDPTGTPSVGEITKVTSGNTYANMEFYWDGEAWMLAQSKTTVNQSPLFQLYDMSGVSLSDESKYPNSTFKGNMLFSYNNEGTVQDSILNIKLTYDVYGQIQYRNFLNSVTYSYTNNLISYNIDGYYFYNKFDPKSLSSNFLNDWYQSPYTSKQYIVDNFTFDGTSYIFDLSQVPDCNNGVYDISITVTSLIDDNTSIKTLTYGTDFLLSGNKLLIPSLLYKDQITVKTYSKNGPVDGYTGFYELPINLTANPNNDNIELVSFGDVYQQFIDVLTGQDGFTGEYSSDNNYRNTKKSPIYGKNIIQNKNDLLLPMLLSSNSNYDVISALEYCKKEYRKFKNKFEQKITEYYTKGTYTSSDSSDTWVVAALKDIAKGKTSISPFFNSGMGKLSSGEPDWFIPPTPSFLGFYDLVVPEITQDINSSGTINFIKNHDNSLTVCYGDFRDNVLLDLETRIYNSTNLAFKKSTYVLPANYIDSLNQYSTTEWNSMLQPFFERWCSEHNLDYKTNTTYDITNPYTWNWSNVISNIDGTFLPGSSKGIFLKYYNTFTPHTTPWEMIGYKNKPNWWENYYGVAPYTSNNKMMWRDISKGLDQSTGKTTEFTYPYLMQYIPVDSQGYLLDPYAIGIAKNYPNESDRNLVWKFTDCGPIEILWRISSEYGYSVSQVNYLAKPSKFVSETWNTVSNTSIMTGEISEQKINTDLERRPHYSDYTLHNEFINNSFVTKTGLQQIIVYYLMNNSLSISNFADLVRGLDVRLSYKMAGYTDKSQLTIMSDSSNIIPQENYSVILYNSPIIREEYYSGVLIVKANNGYNVYGYNMDKPVFLTYELDKSSSQTITIDDTYRHKIRRWEPNMYYPKGTNVEYDGSFYISNIDNNSTISFDASKWDKVNRPEVTSYIDKKWYNNISLDKTVVTVPYGTLLSSEQDVIDFFNGYQRYLEDSGWEFKELTDDANNLDFKYMSKQFLSWAKTIPQENDFITLSPLSSEINFSCDEGEISDIISTIRGSYGIVDKYGNNISPYDISFNRGYGTIQVVGLNDNEIYGLRLSIYEMEHILIVDNKTIFNDILYNPIYNIRQPRFKITGFKTGSWNGRYDAPGFIVTGDTIIPNFERTADNFRKFFNIEYTFDNKLQERAWANAGFLENNDLTSLSMSLTNQFEFYQGAIQNKGTPVVFDRLMNSSFISNNKDIKFYEEWAFRVGDYGGESINNMMDFSIKQSQFKNDPQMIIFNTIEFQDTGVFEKSFTLSGESSETFTITDVNTSCYIDSICIDTNGSNGTMSLSDSNGVSLVNDYDLSSTTDYKITFNNLMTSNSLILDYDLSQNITCKIKVTYKNIPNITTPVKTNNIVLNDIVSSNTGKIIEKDSLWNWRLFGKNVNWASKYYNQIESNFLPNAGYVNIDTIDYFCKDITSLNTKYYDVLSDNTNSIITADASFDISEYTEPTTVTKPFISENINGYYRVNKVSVDVTKPFNIPVVINIGRKDQLPDGNNTYSSSTIARITYEDLQEIKQYDLYPSTLWNSYDYDDNSIMIQYCFLDSIMKGMTSNSQIDVKSSICYDKIIEFNSTTNSGTVTITIECELIEDSMKPNDRVWLYSDINGDWMTSKLKYDGDNINFISPPSYTGQGSVVTLSTVNDINLYNNNIPLILSGVQNIHPDLVENQYPKINNSLSVDITYSTKNLQIMQMMTDAGMNITNMYLNIVEPFYGSGDTVTFDVGTNANPSQLAQSSIISNPTPTVPDFNTTDPIVISIPNSNISAFNDSGIVNVDIIRSGNIFGLPNTCSDLPSTTVGWEVYPIDTDGNYLDNDGNVTTTKNVIQSGTAIFETPDTTSDVYLNYWDQKASITVSSAYTLLKIDLINPVNGTIDSVKNNSVIELIADETNSSANYLNPSVPGKTTLDVGLFNLDNSNEYITATVENATSGYAVLTIEYTYFKGFEIYDSEGNASICEEEGNGGNIFRFQNCRFDSLSDVDNKNFTSGDYIEVDDYNNGRWGILKFDGTNWNLAWEQSTKIDSSLIQDAVIYNQNSDIEEILELWDPYKGYIPSNIKNNIDFYVEYDPANYNTSSSTGIDNDVSNIWEDSYVGKLWWNISAVKYLDYENISTDYRAKYWGTILPDTEVLIYEWVKSPVTPDQWNSYVSSGSYIQGYSQNPSGTVPSDLSDFKWVTSTTFNRNSNKIQTSYYFWVLNPTTLNGNTSRDISGYGISQIIENPKNNGISYISIIDNNKMLVGGSKNYLDDTSCSIKVRWVSDNSDMNYHKEWSLVRHGDSSEVIPSTLWKKMTDCLIGYNELTTIKTYKFTLSIGANVNDVYITVNDPNNNLENISNYGEIKIGDHWYNFTSITNNKIYLSSTIQNEIPINSPVVIYNTEIKEIKVPDPSLTEFESNGNLIRPSQSWFPAETTNIASRYARKIFVQEFNNLVGSSPVLDTWYNWENVFSTGEAEPDESQYSYRTDSQDYINSLIKNKILKIGDRILYVDSSESSGFWILYEYDPYSPESSNSLVIVNTQGWRLKDGELWESIDWYADGYSVSDYPIYTYQTKADMLYDASNIDMTLLNGTLIKVNTQDANDTRWSWYVYNENGWKQVAKEKSTIKLLDNFWSNTYQYGYSGNYDITQIAYRDGSKELKWILDSIYSSFFTTLQKNELFFSMVKLAISLNKEIDWVIKTSFMFLGGYTEQLSQQPVSFVNHLDNIISYINIMKPYHTTIRDYVNSVSIGPDIASISITDFDFPVYTDPTKGSTNQYRILNPTVQYPLNHKSIGSSSDTAMVKSSENWSFWYDNYLKTNYDVNNWDENWNPIRKKNITIKFNRCGNYTDDEIENLPSNVKKQYEFKGTYVTSEDFTNGDWDEYPWDYYSGWENELNYFTGDTDTNSPISTNSNIQPTGSNDILQQDVSRKDFDISNNDLGNENYDPMGIDVDGNNFIQPEIDENRPEENVMLGLSDPLTIVSTMIDDSKKVIQKYMFTKDSINTWEYINLGTTFGSLIKDNTTTLDIDTNNAVFHDPNNPSAEMLEKVRLTYVDMGYSEDKINSILGRMFPGVVYINNERILYWTLTKGSGTVVTLSNLQRQVNGLVSVDEVHSVGDKVYDGSILSWATMKNLEMNQRKDIVPTISYTLTNNVWTLDNLNICYNKE